MAQNTQFNLNQTEEQCLIDALAFIKETVAKHSIRTLGGGPTDPGVPGNELIAKIAHKKYEDCVDNNANKSRDR